MGWPNGWGHPFATSQTALSPSSLNNDDDDDDEGRERVERNISKTVLGPCMGGWKEQEEEEDPAGRPDADAAEIPGWKKGTCYFEE